MSEPSDRELDRRVAKLPRSIHPERDLWTDIAGRIAAPPSSLAARRRKLAAAGAAAVAAAAAVTLLVARRNHRPPWPWPSPAPSAVAVSGPPAPAPAPPVDALASSKERIVYRAAVLALESSLAENRPYLSSQAAERLEQSLGVLDHAIEATEQALARDPDSAELRSQLWDEYQQKIDALTAVVDLVTRTS
jgi:hypothetical protein